MSYHTRPRRKKLGLVRRQKEVGVGESIGKSL